MIQLIGCNHHVWLQKIACLEIDSVLEITRLAALRERVAELRLKEARHRANRCFFYIGTTCQHDYLTTCRREHDA